MLRSCATMHDHHLQHLVTQRLRRYMATVPHHRLQALYAEQHALLVDSLRHAVRVEQQRAATRNSYRLLLKIGDGEDAQWLTLTRTGLDDLTARINQQWKVVASADIDELMPRSVQHA